MTRNPHLDDAIAVFRELGWDEATPDQVPDLPIGTPEQQRRAVAGLRSGDWGDWRREDSRLSWVSGVEVSTAMLALFAARVGVDARRTVALLPPVGRVNDEVLANALAPRGPTFAAAFVAAACVSSRRAWEHSTSAYGGTAVLLVDAHDLPVPESVEYLKDWVVYAALALGLDAELYPRDRLALASDVGRRQYAEHARAAVAVGLPATGPFGEVFVAAVHQGWMDRAEAIDLAFGALDSAQRPGDRKVWVSTLVDGLALGDDELVARADALVPVLASGEAPVIEALAPRLIAAVGEHQLADVLGVALLARTTKARRTVLAAAASRTRPDPAVVEELTPVLVPLADAGDRQVSRAARALLAAWGIEAEPVAADEPGPRGLWQPSPPVWEVPRLEIGEPTPSALVDCLARVTQRPEGMHDLERETLLALANAVAHESPEAARGALRGIRGSNRAEFGWLSDWAAGTELLWGHDRLEGEVGRPDIRPPLMARDWMVTRQLGEIPVLLSQPSFHDLRIDPADLLARLRTYAEQGVAALESDLQLALLRTDVTLTDPAIGAELARQAVPVRLQSGATTRPTAGAIAAGYLADPVVEPDLELNQRWGYWQAAEAVTPRSLAALPDRVAAQGRYFGAEAMAVFPTWGEAGLIGIRAGQDAGAGIELRQLARRGAPLPPAAAVNLLGAQRSFHARAAADGTLAVIEAWQRGLLRPGVPDVGYLDAAPTPSGLAAFARALTEVAEQGMASLVWPVLNDLVTASVGQPKLIAGTAEVIDAIASLLPEARAAVENGRAEPAALDLAGVRTIAARSGSSRAVELARSVVKALPDGGPSPVPAPAAAQAVPTATMPLAEIWPAGLGPGPVVVDGGRLTVVQPGGARGDLLCVDLAYDHLPGRVYRVAKGWMYDLQSEGQCAAHEYPAADPESAGDRANCFLRWDGHRVIASAHRDWRTGTDGPLSDRSAVPPLTTSMVAVILVALSNTGDWSRESRRTLEQHTADGVIGWAAVGATMPAVLASPLVSPARMAGHLRKQPTLLPSAWPVLVESVRFAAAQGTLPRWLNQVLDVAIWFAPQLGEATALGRIPAEPASWPGLADIAGRAGKSTAIGKARTLRAQLGL